MVHLFTLLHAFTSATFDSQRAFCNRKQNACNGATIYMQIIFHWLERASEREKEPGTERDSAFGQAGRKGSDRQGGGGGGELEPTINEVSRQSPPAAAAAWSGREFRVVMIPSCGHHFGRRRDNKHISSPGRQRTPLAINYRPRAAAAELAAFIIPPLLPPPPPPGRPP